MFRLSYKIMLSITIISTIGGIITLLPCSLANYPNLLGYKSVCTFTPAATLLCFFIAGTSCFIRSTFIKDNSGTKAEKFNKHKKNLIIIGLILILAIMYTNKYKVIKQPYIDGITSASYQ